MKYAKGRLKCHTVRCNKTHTYTIAYNRWTHEPVIIRDPKEDRCGVGGTVVVSSEELREIRQGATVEQSRKMSLAETLVSTAIGYVVAIAAQSVIFPLFGLHVGAGQHFAIAAFFTLVSIVRGYFVRRMFNAIHARENKRQA